MKEIGHVSAVVINWDLADETVKAIWSLQAQTVSCSIIVVDNGSTDDSVSIITEQCPGIELICLPENQGFASACNTAIVRALANTQCEYVLLLNNDARVHQDAVHEMLLAIATMPQAGIVGPKIYYDESPQKIWYAGARRRRIVLAAADVGRDQDDKGQFADMRSVDYVFGAAMLIHRRVFECVGLFDESFFLYLEDLDFCLRAQRAGFPLIFVPKALIWHQGSASTARDPSLRRFHTIKGTIIFLRKHATPITILPNFLFWSLVFARVVIQDFIGGNMLTLGSYWSGAKSGLLAEIRRT